MQKYHERICPEHQEEADGKVDCDVVEKLTFVTASTLGTSGGRKFVAGLGTSGSDRKKLHSGLFVWSLSMATGDSGQCVVWIKLCAQAVVQQPSSPVMDDIHGQGIVCRRR